MMTQKMKRVLWYASATLSAVAALLFFNKAFEMVWRSAFTNADVPYLRRWLYIYLALLVVAIVGIVLCIRKGNTLGKTKHQ